MHLIFSYLVIFCTISNENLIAFNVMLKYQILSVPDLRKVLRSTLHRVTRHDLLKLQSGCISHFKCINVCDDLTPIRYIILCV